MEKKKRKKISLEDFGMEKIILLAVAGVLLLLANVPEKNKGAEGAAAPEEKTELSSGKEAYIASLENKLVHILENVAGVGRVEVMITLKASGESVLNKDISEQTESDEEDGENTEKDSRSIKREEETVLADESGNAAPYVLKEMAPEINGVVIACEGAGDRRIEAAVTGAAQVLFGVPASHIKVLKMEGSK